MKLLVTGLFLCLTGIILTCPAEYSPEKTGYVSATSLPEHPSLPTYSELIRLAQKGQPDTRLTAKVKHLLNTPFISLSPSIASSMPTLPNEPKLGGPFLRVAAWNIERGFKLPGIILALKPGTEETLSSVKRSPKPSDLPSDPHAEGKKPDPQETKTLLAEKSWLSQSQIIMMSEVDNGMKRTGYQNIGLKLANALNMHAVYAVEFLELGPLSKRVQDYVKQFSKKPDQESREMMKRFGEDLKVDPQQYRGLHGSLILSKYPILSARIIRLPKVYDWYTGEKTKLSTLERVRRKAADTVFLENMLTELRYGSRIALAVDVAVPHLPEGRATFVVTHLENRTTPKGRLTQMKYLLNVLKDIHHPIIISGDFNTTGGDVSPTSIPKEVRNRIKDPTFWTRRMIGLLAPFGYVIDLGLQTTQFVNNLYNPAAISIPLLAPNRERGFFKLLGTFQFADGGVLDKRGEKAYGSGGLLADSNERWLKGFVPTFSFERPLMKGLIGKYKLDWFFVKDYLKTTAENPKKGPYCFAPHFGRTLTGINRLFPERLSDHDPITIDLPFQEPPQPES